MKILTRLTIERVMLYTLFALIFAMATRVAADTDMWWHIRSGQSTLEDGMIYADRFSSTMLGEPWINHGWGGQIVLTMVWQLFGINGMSLYTTILATVGMGFIYMMCVGTVYTRSFAIVLGAATAAVFWSPRPQMLSFLLSTIVLFLLYRYKYERKDYLWFIPPIMALWGNLHAGFSIGAIFLIILFAGEFLNMLTNPNSPHAVGWAGVRRLFIVGVVSAAALVINAYGPQILLVPGITVSIGVLRDFIQEWNSPNFHINSTWPFIIMVVVLFGAIGASRRRLDWTEFGLLGVTIFMSLWAGRHISVFAVVATPLLTRHLQDILDERGWRLIPNKVATPTQGRINLAIILLVTLGAIVKINYTFDPQIFADEQARVFPLGAIEYLKQERPPGVLFNSYNWGGYLLYALPEYPIFVDGRTDLYGDRLLRPWINAYFGRESWRGTFDEFNVNVVLVEPEVGIARVLRNNPAWRVAYEDEISILFVRVTPLLAGQ
jgi:hypothetical protein